MDNEIDGPFKAILSGLFESFGVEATTPRMFGYWLGLKDIPIATLQRAVMRAITELDRLPLPEQLRRLSGELSPEDRCIAAWADVQRAIPCGPYKHVDFRDKYINAAIRNMGGWPNFVSRFTDAESEKWARHEFLKCYEAFARRGVNGEICNPLPGLSEAECIGGVLTAPTVHLIDCEPQRADVRLIAQNPFSVDRL